MKKLLLILTLLAFAVSISAVFAADIDQMKQEQPDIKCCFQDGQCLQTKQDNCALKMGKIVGDCKDCPGVWGKAK